MRLNNRKFMRLYNSQVGCCVDCEKFFEPTELTTHHVPGKFEGGTDSSGANFLLCRACHDFRHVKEEKHEQDGKSA